MADLKQIQFKRSNTSGKRPLPADIAEGELAINIKDATMFTKNADGVIIDLGFAKGGQVDGNINQINGNFTTKGSITSGAITSGAISASGNLDANEITSKSGSFRSKATAGQNSHYWFHGTEVVGKNRDTERAVFYAPTQTATTGQLNLRVYNGKDYEADTNNALFVFNGSGDFQAPRDSIASRNAINQRTLSSIEIETPTVIANLVDHYKKPFVSGSSTAGYDSSSLVTYVYNSATDVTINGLNYLRKFRPHSSATIFHELVDGRTSTPAGAEVAYYTGVGPSKKLWGFNDSGNIYGANSLAAGMVNPSTLGDGSIALVDTNTGIRRRPGADQLDFYMKGGIALGLQSSSGTNSNISYNRLLVQHSDANGTAINPPGNNAQLQVNTSGDANNVGDNGLTLIGYYANSGEYYHYFRGKGAASFSMARGVTIDRGGLSVTGNSTVNGTLTSTSTIQASRFDAMGDISFKNPTSRHIRFEYTNTAGAVAVDGYIFKDGPQAKDRRPGIRINCATPNGQGSGDYVFGEDGNLTVPGQVHPGNFSNFDGRFQMNTVIASVANIDAVAWNAKTGMYQASTGGASMLIDHRYMAAGSCPAYQIRVDYRNRGMWYRSARDGYGFESPWAEIITTDSEDVANKLSLFPKQLNGMGVNLNTIKARSQAGVYYQPGNAGATAANNYPIAEAGSLVCTEGAYSGLIQEYTGFSSGRKFVRGINGTISGDGPWNGWKEYFINTSSSLGVATANGWGGASIAIGDSDTGFRQEGDGILNAWANNQRIMRWNTGQTISYKQLYTEGVNGAAIRMNASAATQTVYMLGTRAGANSWYIGAGGADNVITWHNYHFSTTAQLRQNDIYFNKLAYGAGDANFNNVYIRSDERLKRNFKKIENALDKVDHLDGLIYEKKNTRESEEYETVEAGIIAQRLQEVLPEAVTEHEDTLVVSASATIALLVNAIKELKERVEYLESK